MGTGGQQARNLPGRAAPVNNLFSSRSSGFTLIELLIVVAIIAVLAAIAVPNFQEAQVRAQVSRVRSDLRTIGGALELYAVDNNAYPPTVNFYEPSPSVRLRVLTTPVSYLGRVPTDPFDRRRSVIDDVLPPGEPRDRYWYNTGDDEFGISSHGNAIRERQWSLTSGGPDLILEFPYYAFSPTFVNTGRHLVFIYDPTNGTTSRGEIFRRGGFVPYPVPGMTE